MHLKRKINNRKSIGVSANKNSDFFFLENCTILNKNAVF